METFVRQSRAGTSGRHSFIKPTALYLCGLLFVAAPGSGLAQQTAPGDAHSPDETSSPDVAFTLVREAVGTNAAAIQATVDTFRTDLGTLRPNTKSSFQNGRREINWDGVPDASSAPNSLPADFFNTTSPRGVVFSTAGSGFQVSADSSNPTATPLKFGNLNATYPDQFETFSAQRLFSAVDSNVVDITFFVPGTNIPATVTGFGAVFTDVDIAGSTKIQFLDPDGNLLFARDVLSSAGAQRFSFLGVSFQNGQRVAKVRIISGNTALGPNDNPATGIDVVAMDDFIYAEPQPARCVPTTITGNIGQASTVYPSTSGTQTGRVSQNGVDSSCGAAKSCPGVASSSTSFAFDTYPFVNNSNSTKCVTFNFPTSCGANQAVHPVAYLGTFDPANPCANYLGDVGHSVNAGTTGSFSVNVPANSIVVLVVHEVGTVPDCAYSFTVSGLPECYVSQLPCPPANITGNIGQGSTVYPSTSGVQTGRISQNGVDSSCASPKTCPGVASVGTSFAFDAYQFQNTSTATRCVTFNFPTACGANQAIHPVAYLGSFDPSNPCTNYLGDVGHSVNAGTTGVFSVNIPANSTIVLVVHEVGTVADCPSYSFSVSGLAACPPPSTCVLNCPSNSTTSTAPNQCGAVVEFPLPTSSGNCGSVNASPASGTFFPKGTTSVTATGSGGANCAFNVTVVDTQAPNISCPGDISVQAAPGENSAVVTFGTPGTSDNCPGVGAAFSNPASGSTFPVGTTTVTSTVTDSSGNTGNCTFNVTVTPAAPTPTPTPTPTATPPATPTPTPTPGASPGRLGNISTRLRVETGDNILIGGFIVTGTQPKKIMVRGIGPSLPFLDPLANPTLELHGPSGLIESNDDWVNSPNKQAIIDTTIPPTNNLESAIVATVPANGAGYTAVVRGLNDGTGIGVVEAYDLDSTVDSKLANISTRGLVTIGDDVLIAGTIVVGQAPQKVLLRAIGPSLPIAGKLANPTMELRDGNGGLLEANDNWIDSPNKQLILDTTIPPTNDLESAIFTTLPANNASYTAIVRGVGGAPGIAVVEVYALN